VTRRNGGIKIECTKEQFNMLSGKKKRTLISIDQTGPGTDGTYFIIAIRTVFFSTISDGADFSCSFLSRSKNVVSIDNGLYGWDSRFTERIQVGLKFCCP
jgi:hypothetical protein